LDDQNFFKITSHNWIETWVLKIAKSCFSLISVLLIQRTPHFSATSNLYILDLGIIQVPLQKAADLEDCSHDR
jgi:hypothetical protein